MAACPARAEDHRGCGRVLEPTARAGKQRARPATGYAEHDREISAVDRVPEREIEDLSIAVGQPVHGSHHDQQLLPVARLGFDIGKLNLRGVVVPRGGQILEEIRRSADPGAAGHVAQALPSSDGIQPNAEPIGISQLAHLRVSGNQSVLQSVGGCDRVTENAHTVIKQMRCVPVVQLRDSTLADAYWRIDRKPVLGAATAELSRHGTSIVI